jgi:ABC-2 type transport system ATP-binding protein
VAGRGATKDMMVVDTVTKRYGRGGRGTRPALDGVSLEIPRGGVHAVVGPNGAGKSTLFALVLGFIHANGGDVTVDGLDPRDYVRRNGAGYLPERFGVPAAWRVRPALTAFAERERLGGGRAERKPAAAAAADAALERFGLTEHAQKRVGELSRGMLQRLGLAQALLAPRDLVVLDEPTEGLDPGWRLRLRTELSALRAAGRTVLLASHDLGEVGRVADRVIVLENGRVREVMDTPRNEPVQRYRVELTTPSTEVQHLFPGAVPLDDPEAGGAAYRVTVEDASELNARLAALLATGALMAAVQPDAEPLEERVRRALGGEG